MSRMNKPFVHTTRARRIPPRSIVSRASTTAFSILKLLRSALMLRSLAAHHLLQRMYHFHERFLVFHHYVDVLVRARDFIEHSVVLAALHASGLSCQIGQGEGRTGLLAGHLTPCTVRARAIRFLVTLTPHDIRALAHRTRDDTQVAHTGLDRSFASDPQVL